jgi:succinoglycan biosynthesis protein ExoW
MLARPAREWFGQKTPEVSGVMMSANLPAIAVIIPYFQRKRGLLTKAVYSVLTQQVEAGIHLIVVDDSSPIPAEGELADLLEPYKNQITLKRIPNGGVSHARNVGLDCVRDGIPYVAFLDSDDIWRPGHLARAIRALQNGDDFYFADFRRHDWENSAFARCSTFHPEEHSPLREDDGLFRFDGDFFEQVLRNNPIGTSTVVYRFERFQQLRFDEGLTVSGEDILFWLSIVQNNKSVVFSDHVECDYTAGVNICYDAKWGTEAGMEVSYNDILMLSIVVQRLHLSSGSQQRLGIQSHKLATVLVEQVLHSALRARITSLRWLVKLFWHNWTLCVRSIFDVFCIRAAKALRFESPKSKTPST